MQILDVPFTVTDWARVPAAEVPGESGTSSWRTFESGGLRARRVDYSPGFRSDHFCARGHVLLVLEGAIEIELRDGRTFALAAGSGFQAADDPGNPHRVSSAGGAKVFIVD